MKNAHSRNKHSGNYRNGKFKLDPTTTAVMVILIIVNIILVSLLISVKFGSSDSVETDTSTIDISDITLPGEVSAEPEVTSDVYADYTIESINNSELTNGSLVLVNMTHPYGEPDGTSFMSLYTNANKHYSLTYSNLQLLSDAYVALNKMTDDYYTAEGKSNLEITAAYRTEQEQQEFWNSYVESPEDEQYCEKAGYSDHHTGLAFDVKLVDRATGTSFSYNKNASEKAKWIVDNHKNYGFIMRFPSDKFELTGVYEGNHFRYVGLPHSTYIEDNNLCLDEYMISLKNYTLENGTLQIPCNGEMYTVYYTPAQEGDHTEIHVPKDKEYSVSGDNNGGYIVWYKN